MKDFSSLGLPQQLADSLARMKFSTPTPIQAKAIPVALKGRDILGSAQTGTGKTGAFGIPLIERLLTTDKTTALVMTPTRELASQVQKALLEMLGHGSGIKSALLIGGDSMYRQLNQLKGRPRLIVGTPGRINDHLERRSVNLRDCGFLVLDETDRMLDMGFGVQIDRILRHMPKERQTLLFSATLPPYIIEIAKKYLHMPERIAVGDVHSPIENIKQEMVKLNQPEKYKALSEHLSRRDGSVIVFVKTKHGADRMATKLQRDGHKAEAIHGDLKQSKRDRVIADFRDKEYRILVATDVAARGLDIPHIEHVINYDLPQVAEDYIHRIGRTARAGKTGEAVIFVTPEDGAKWKEIYHLMNPSEKSVKNSERADDKLTNKKSAGRKPGGFKTGTKKAFARKGASPRREDGERRERYDRDARPARESRDARPARGDKDSRPARFDRDSRPARFDREDRDSRPARYSRDARPARNDRDARPARFDREDRGGYEGRGERRSYEGRNDRGGERGEYQPRSDRGGFKPGGKKSGGKFGDKKWESRDKPRSEGGFGGKERSFGSKERSYAGKENRFADGDRPRPKGKPAPRRSGGDGGSKPRPANRGGAQAKKRTYRD